MVAALGEGVAAACHAVVGPCPCSIRRDFDVICLGIGTPSFVEHRAAEDAGSRHTTYAALRVCEVEEVAEYCLPVLVDLCGRTWGECRWWQEILCEVDSVPLMNISEDAVPFPLAAFALLMVEQVHTETKADADGIFRLGGFPWQQGVCFHVVAAVLFIETRPSSVRLGEPSAQRSPEVGAQDALHV